MLSINDFDALVSNANNNLLLRVPALISYTDTNDLSKNITGNESVIAQEVGDNANIYAIWSRLLSSDKWTVMYIGQRSESDIIGRIKQHLFTTPSGTRSKIEKVKELVLKDYQIGISTIFVTPDPLRLSVEDQLIFKNTNNASELPWNHKSRNVSLPTTKST